MSDDSFSRSVDSIKWWSALLFSVFAFVLSIVAMVPIAFVFDKETTFSNSFLYAVSSVVLLVATSLFLRFRKVDFKDFLGKFSVKRILFTPVYYVSYLILSRIAQGIVGLLPNVDLNQKQDFGLESNDPLQLMVIFIALVVLPPLSEEVLFRGLLYRSFKKPFGKVLAAIIVSLVFGAVHGQWNVAADTFVLSLVLIYLVEKSNSLWPAIGLHFFKNTVAYLLVFVFKVS